MRRRETPNAETPRKESGQDRPAQGSLEFMGFQKVAKSEEKGRTRCINTEERKRKEWWQK